MKLNLILTAIMACIAVAIVILSYNQKVTAEEKLDAIGACYTLFNCQGGSIGVFSDEQCRAMGGRSMLNGGICIDLY